MSAEKSRDDTLNSIAKLSVAVLPQELRGPASAFQRRVLVMRRLPDEIYAQEQKIAPFFEEANQYTAQEFLAKLLLNPEASKQIFTYYVVGAEVDYATRHLDKKATEIINKSTKGKKEMAENVKGVVNIMLQVLDAANFVNPFDSLSPNAPSLQDLAGANARTYNMMDFSPQSKAIQSRIPEMFSIQGNPDEIGLVAFLTLLAISGSNSIGEAMRVSLKQQGVSSETVLMLNNIGTVLDEYMTQQLDNLLEIAYMNTLATKSTITDSSIPPVVIAALAMDAYSTRPFLPTTFSTLIDNGLIPGLEPKVAQLFKQAHKEKFMLENPEIFEYSDQHGVKPYQVLTENFDPEKALDLLNDLAPHYTPSDNIEEDYWEFFCEKNKIFSFLRNRVIQIPGDENIAGIYAGAARHGLDIILLSHDQRVLGIQVRSYGISNLRIVGIPGGFVKEAEGFVGNIFSKVLAGLRKEGYLDHPYSSTFERSLESSKFHKDLEDGFRAKAREIDQSITGLPSIDVSLSQGAKPITKQPEEKSVQEERKRRFTIITPENVLRKADLTDEERALLFIKIKEIEFSPIGTYPMRKITCYSGDIRRIIVRGFATTPFGHKIRINLRAVVEFDGTTGTTLLVSGRQDVYKELNELLK